MRNQFELNGLFMPHVQLVSTVRRWRPSLDYQRSYLLNSSATEMKRQGGDNKPIAMTAHSSVTSHLSFFDARHPNKQ